MASGDDVRQEIDAFLEEQRATCLWSLSRHWVPANDSDRRRMLELVQRNGSLEAFQRAALMKRCL